MRVLIDTNVVVSAALWDKDPEAVVLFVVGQPDWEWIIDAA
jgi:predicted nucleic acid-binding protein